MAEEDLITVVVDGSPGAVKAVVDSLKHFHEIGDHKDVPPWFPDFPQGDFREIHSYNTDRHGFDQPFSPAPAGSGHATVRLLGEGLGEHRVSGDLERTFRKISWSDQDGEWGTFVFDPEHLADGVTHL